MTQSQRMARIKALTNGVGNSSINDAHSGSARNAMHIQSSMISGSRNDTYNDNDMGALEYEQVIRTNSILGLDREETRLDCFVCILILVLVLVLLVMIILYAL